MVVLSVSLEVQIVVPPPPDRALLSCSGCSAPANPGIDVFTLELPKPANLGLAGSAPRGRVHELGPRVQAYVG